MSALDEHAERHLRNCDFGFEDGLSCTCGQTEAAAELAELKDGFAYRLAVETERITNRMSELAAQVDGLRLAAGFKEAELAALRARAERAEALARKVEWAAGYYTPTCPECRSWRIKGHMASCALAAVLKGEQR